LRSSGNHSRPCRSATNQGDNATRP
jgi:hypothetical protein